MTDDNFKNMFTTQEGTVFSMENATCPKCKEDSDLSYCNPINGYFTCPNCKTVYDEPTFYNSDYITTVN